MHTEIFFIANCGLLIKTDRISILIDGFNRETNNFTGIPEHAYKDAIEHMGVFKNIDLMLFTHKHDDHYDKEKVKRYMQANKNTKLFIPGVTGDEKYISFQVEDTTINARKISHSGRDVTGDPHYVFYMNTPGKKIYVSGDADFFEDTQIDFMEGKKADVAFYNPLHLNNLNGRKIIRAINAEKNFIYHIPSETKDPYQLRKMAIRDIKKYKGEIPYTELLLKNMKAVYL